MLEVVRLLTNFEEVGFQKKFEVAVSPKLQQKFARAYLK